MEVVITTDGSGTSNCGPGGWAAILECDGRELVVTGGGENITNNMAELLAVENALHAIRRHGIAVCIRTDSRNVIGWLYGFDTLENKPNTARRFRIQKENAHIQQIVDRILDLQEKKSLDWHFEWVRGHNGEEKNERCDKLAKAERQKRLQATS